MSRARAARGFPRIMSQTSGNAPGRLREVNTGSPGRMYRAREWAAWVMFGSRLNAPKAEKAPPKLPTRVSFQDGSELAEAAGFQGEGLRESSPIRSLTEQIEHPARNVDRRYVMTGSQERKGMISRSRPDLQNRVQTEQGSCRQFLSPVL